MQALTDTCAKEAEVTHFDETPRQHMLEKALHELLCRKGACPELACVRCTIAECDLGCIHAAAIFKGDQPTVADRHAMDVWCQVLERSLPVAYSLAMYYPRLTPDFLRHLGLKVCFF